jgi:acetyltransferase-like isoleucine patch superfamily enzyme
MGIIQQGKKILGNNEKAISFFLGLYNRLPFNNRRKIHGRNNRLELSRSLLKKTRIYIKGSDNRIVLGDRCTLRCCSIYISGNGNSLVFGDKVAMISGEIHIEDDGNIVSIGSHASFLGKTHLACIEGTKITIGDNCLFSSDVTLRTGDSHSILGPKGDRINLSEDITLANHVWVGNRAILTKGACVAQDSVVATGAILTGAVEESGVVIGGVPAKVIKQGINWDIQRIK